ncbi:MAG TPA: hypothetical protein VHQ39_15365 [Dongiaceae bacterium]|jgi:hypothetical protein|nr:hypothetical protein [Dongiaceae bacterium]
MSKRSKLARTAGPIVLAACVALTFTSAALAAGNDWNHRGWGHNDWHGYNNRSSSSFGLYLGGPGYYAPPPTYYYAPPPVYYAPPPTYYYQPQPSFGLQLNVH